MDYFGVDFSSFVNAFPSTFKTTSWSLESYSLLHRILTFFFYPVKGIYSIKKKLLFAIHFFVLWKLNKRISKWNSFHQSGSRYGSFSSNEFLFFFYPPSVSSSWLNHIIFHRCCNSGDHPPQFAMGTDGFIQRFNATPTSRSAQNASSGRGEIEMFRSSGIHHWRAYGSLATLQQT